MAHTRNQELESRFNTLQHGLLETQQEVQQLSATIASRDASMNASVQIAVQSAMAEVKNELESVVVALCTKLKIPLDDDAPKKTEGETSSHSFQPHHFQRDIRLPRVDVTKFDGSDPTGWVTQMEHYFSLYNITDDLAKLRYGVLHLDQERWQWWQWRKTSRQGYIAWTQFVAELYERFDTDTNHLGRLTKLKQSGTVEDFIAAFEHLAFRTEGMTDAFFRECFISGLKEEVRAHVLMARPTTWVEATKKAKEAQQIVSSQNRKPSFFPRPKPANPTTPSAPLKIQKLTRAEMAERQLKGLCYNCDDKYFPGHKCKEQKLFMAISEDIQEDDDDTSPVPESPETSEINPPSDPPAEEPIISLNALTGFSAPQTLKLIGYIKHRKVIILVDSGSTHNFIHRRIAQETHCYIHAVNNFQIMIANGGSMKCGGRCENVRLQIGDYNLKSHMFAIDMGGCDIVLGAEWLRTLGPILMDFQNLTMQFDQGGHKHKFQGITAGSPEIISSHRMEKLLKKGHSGVIAQLHAIQATEIPPVPQDLQAILSKHQTVFSTPQGLPPSRGVHDHSIPLVPGSLPPNIRPYRHPFAQKNEIEKMVQELLTAGVIRPSTSPYSSPIVMVLKKEGSWRMCPDFRALNKLTIKDKFPIPVIDDLLDELSGAQFFTKLDLRSGYHQIRMKESDIPKTAFRTHEGHYEFLVMPFGLCNAPSTFQSLMNHVFRPFLRHFVLVFFDDILIYSKTWKDHLTHVDQVLSLLAQHQLFLKQSKCAFGASEVEYLGHRVGKDGVRVDPKKIEAMQDWPHPKTLKSLRGFLGLTGYYRKFVKNYGKIAAPLTALLKKNSFTWTPAADQAFQTLKMAMCTTPVLALPDFTKTFVLECDASGKGIGAVLMQAGRPLAFTSKQLSEKNLGKPIYEKEMLAILHAVELWRPYLLGQRFQIKTDHQSLKYFLEQRISSQEQQKWVTKLFGYDYEIIYKKGKDNVVADALSRKYEDEGSLFSLSFIVPEWLQAVHQEWLQDPKSSHLIQQLKNKAQAPPGYSWLQDELRYKGRLYLSKQSKLKSTVLSELHATPTAGHSGFTKTYDRVKRSFFWDGMKQDIRQFVAECEVCQRNKGETVKSPGTLQPLPIPPDIWKDISMDFITGLPKSGNKSVIMVVVDRLSKYAHFCALHHPFTASTVAQIFMDQVFKLHGMPNSIVSDRDPTFTSNFWQELFKLQGTQLHLSSAYHPQTDGQTEVVNKCLETYLRCFASEKQHQWAQWLPLAEWWYNTTYHTTTRMTPFEAVYGQKPPSVLSYLPGTSKVQAVDHTLTVRADILRTLKENLVMAQNRMKQQADQGRSERQFVEGDQVFLRLQPYKQTSLKADQCQKLAPKFYGPYTVLKRVGQVAYQLALPSQSKLHPVFHVSCLKKVIGTRCQIQTNLPELVEEGSIWLQPEAVLDQRERRLRQRTIKEVLVQWKDMTPADATWEPATILQQFPHLKP